MAYSAGSTPLPPPPNVGAMTMAHDYNLEHNAQSHLAQSGVAPVNQMSNGFGGRMGGNPTAGMRPQVSGGNRTSQHVATPGNNNISYATTNLLNSAQSLWQKGQDSGIAPANGMSYGFMKNTAARQSPNAGTPAAPVTPPPPPAPVATTPVPGPGSPVGAPPAQGTAAPKFANGMGYDMFNGTTHLYQFNTKTQHNDTVDINNLTQAQVLQLMQRPINQQMLAPGYYYDNGHIYKR